MRVLGKEDLEHCVRLDELQLLLGNFGVRADTQTQDPDEPGPDIP